MGGYKQSHGLILASQAASFMTVRYSGTHWWRARPQCGQRSPISTPYVTPSPGHAALTAQTLRGNQNIFFKILSTRELYPQRHSGDPTDVLCLLRMTKCLSRDIQRLNPIFQQTGKPEIQGDDGQNRNTNMETYVLNGKSSACLRIISRRIY